MLRDGASHQPDVILAALRGRTSPLGRTVRIGPAGLFVGPCKYAELADIIEQVAQDDVFSVTMRRVRTRGSAAERVRAAFFGFVLTAVAAGGGGGAAGYFAGHSETMIDEILVYRATRVY